MKTLLQLLLILSPIIAISQSTWRNGSITLKDGTVLSGQINDQEWNYAHKEIEFRKDSDVKKYTVNDISSFATDRPARYESAYIVYDGDKQDLKDLPYGRETQNLIKDKVFLEVKVNAPIGLLFMAQRDGRPHYFVKEDTTVTELLNRKYQSQSGNATISSNPKYLRQLNLIASGCANLQTSLNSTSYNNNELRRIITKINQCKNNPINPIWSGTESKRKHLMRACQFRDFTPLQVI